MAWGEPRPLPPAQRPVLPFRPDFLPGPIRSWVLDVAERMQCPVDYPGSAALVMLGALIGRKCAIRPKQHDDWTVVPNLWGAVVGDPGVMKTPAIREVLRPLQVLEEEGRQRFEAELRDYRAANLVAEQVQKVDLDRLRKAVERGEPGNDLAAKVVAGTSTPPIRSRLIVNDATVEKLGEILAGNPNGVLIFRDELTGFLRSLERQGQESARAFYLEAWDGKGSFTYDRIGRGTLDIASAIVSILGGIQPGPLGQFFQLSEREGAGTDGLIQRFQVMVWPDVSPQWRNVDTPPLLAEQRKAERLYGELHHLDEERGARMDPERPDGLPCLHFDQNAQVRFDAWRENLERRLRSWSDSPRMLAHLAKYRSLVPSIALILHLAGGRRTGAVGEAEFVQAIGWAEYLESHAWRIYSLGQASGLPAEHVLARKLLDGELKDGFTLREVERRGWSGLAQRGDVERAVETLVALGWLNPERVETGGRPTTRYRIHPGIRRDLLVGGKVREGTDKTDERGPEALEGGEKRRKPGWNEESERGPFVSGPAPTEADKTDERSEFEVAGADPGAEATEDAEAAGNEPGGAA